MGPSRLGDSLTYSSPNFNGLQGRLALIVDYEDGGNDSKGIDGYNPAITYSIGPIAIGASAMEWDDGVEDGTSGDSKQDVWGVAGSYKFGMFRVAAQWEDRDESEVIATGVGNNDGADAWSILGEAYLGNNTIRAHYGSVDYDDGHTRDEMDVWTLSLQHNFSKRTRVYAEYAVNDIENNGTAADEDMDAFSLGLRHDF